MISALAVALLASGFSRRMGRSKALLPWHGGTVIEHHLASWGSLGVFQIGIVARPDDAPLRATLAGHKTANVILNPRADLGMMESLRAASAWEHWHPAATHFAIVLVDQPQIPTTTLCELWHCASHEPASIWQPAWNDQHGHPVILPRAHFLKLATTPQSNLRDWLRGHQHLRRFHSCTGPEILDDLDTPAEYREAFESLHAA